jgi:predicted O-methyltransferase YrrM
MLARALRWAADNIEVSAAIRDFRRAPLEPDEAFRFASTYEFGWVHANPVQIESEIVTLLRRVAGINAQRVLEIGTSAGGTLFLFTRVCASDAVIVSVELAASTGQGYPPRRARLLTSFARCRQSVHLVRGNSHETQTVDAVRRAMGGAVDFLFIDGDHSYEGVKQDFENYSPLVRAGGLIAFHDIVAGPANSVGGVPRYWDEIKNQFEHEEFVADWNQGGYGIGVIQKAQHRGDVVGSRDTQDAGSL